MRAFLAIPVQPPALASFQDFRQQLATQVAAVRWAPAESAHITLHFFGAISVDEADRGLAAVRPVIAAQPPMTLRLRGLGCFPPRGPARVLWFGVDGAIDALSSCARACSGALRDAGFPVELRPYSPHCTLGRPRRPWPAEARERWQRHMAMEPMTPAFLADRAVLYESTTADARTVHVPRETVRFATVQGP